MAERIVLGIDELDRLLRKIPAAQANRAARAGLLKGARLAARLIKAQIPSRYKGVRAAISGRLRRSQPGQPLTALAGAGRKSRRKTTPKRTSKGGVGISSANVHWFLLGTGERSRTSKGDAPTGRMPQFPAVKQAMSGGLASVMQAVTDGVRQQFERELAKIKKR